MRLVWLALALTLCFWAVAHGQDLYLYKRGTISAILGARGELTAFHNGVTPVRAALAGTADDVLVDTYPLGFSFPYYGNPRVRELSVGPNGGLRTTRFAPVIYPCKSVFDSLFCRGASADASVLGAYITDLWPGTALAQGLPVSGGIFVWQDPARGAFSALWEERRYFAPGLLSNDPALVDLDVSMSATVRADGRVRFMWQEMGPTASLQFQFVGVFAGLRAPRSMSAAPFVARQSGNDARLQETWNVLTPAAQTTTGFFVDAAHALQGTSAELCMVPDVDLASLLPQSICAVPNVTLGGTQLELTVPDTLLGCVRAGIALLCEFGADANATNATTGATAATELGPGLLRCALPGPPFNWTAFNQSFFGLTFVDVDSMEGANRSVGVGLCGAVSGPTLDFNASCPLDALGEPGIADCALACSGSAVPDRNGNCCLAGVDCAGVCVPPGEPALHVPAVLRRLQGALTVGTTQSVCCRANEVDCEGLCQGCSCTACECPLALPEQRPYCPTSPPEPTLRPTVQGEAPDGSDTDALFQLPTIFLFLIGVLIASSVIRVARFYFFSDNTTDWLTIARAMGAGAGAAKVHLTAAEIEARTQLVVLRDGEVVPHEPSSSEADGDEDDDDEDDDDSAPPPAGAAVLPVAARRASGAGSRRRSEASSRRGSSPGAMGVPFVAAAAADLEREGAQHGVCAICICEFEDGEVLRKLPCAHFFHRDCVDEWFGRSTLCPMCKQDVRGAIDPEEDI